MSPRTVVVGAGIGGLVAARAITQAGESVVLLEASDRPGGVIRSERRDGFLLETGPNTVRPTAPVWDLTAELGLRDRALLSPPRLPRYVDFGGALHALPASPAALLGTRLLSPGGKLRLLAEPLRRSGAVEEESVLDFFSRRLGAEVALRIVEPFVGGIFAGSAARLSVSAAFPTLARWDRTHGGLLRGAIRERPARGSRAGERPPRGLLSFRDGLETLPRALAAELGDAYRAGTRVERIDARPGGFRIEAGGQGHSLDAERVVLAVPAWRAGELVSGFAPGAAAALGEIFHPPLAVLHLAWEEAALRRPLRGFGHLVVPTPSRRILGAVWSSSLFPGRAPAGWALLTVFLGGARDPGALALSDDALREAAERDLEAEGLTRGKARTLMITRWPRSIPQYERGHAARLRALDDAEARHPGLFFAGNYRSGISVGDVIASARETARRAAAPPPPR